MKKFVLILIILIMIIPFFSQEKYFIYFTDKGNVSKKLNKSTKEFSELEKTFSEKAIERRKRVNLDEYINYDDISINKDYLDLLEHYGIHIINKLNWFNSVSVYISKEQKDKIKDLPFIKEIVPVKKITTIKSEKIETDQNFIKKLNKTNYLYNYGLSLTQMELSDVPKVHDIGITGKDVILGILDSGFRWKNNDGLSQRKVIAEKDFVQDDDITENETKEHKYKDRSDQDSHGTHVFSICGAFRENGVIGPAFDASFLLAKTEYGAEEINLEEDNYAAALEWMEKNGVDITTSSLGYTTFDAGQLSYTYSDMDGKTTLVTKAAEKAFEKGVLTLTAAGNDGNNSWKYISAPGDGKNILTIGAVTSSNIKSSFSSFGPTYDGRIKPEIVAMGTSVAYISVSNKNGAGSIFSGNGTSYATPIVAGIAAQLYSAFPHLTNVQARNILINSCDKVDNPDNNTGYGLISALKAVTYPNFEKLSSSIKIYKIFYNDNGIKNGSQKLFIKKNNNPFVSYNLSSNDGIKFIQEIESFSSSDSLTFYFEYKNSLDETIREPKENYYNITSGSSTIVTSIRNIYNLPEEFHLYQNYPNPFNPGTNIEFDLPTDSNVKIKLFNSLGQEIAILFEKYLTKNKHNFYFDVSKYNLASGVYFYQLIAIDKVITKKMVYIK